jgi:hypothetical protein
MRRDPGIQNSQESVRGVAKDAYRVFACRAITQNTSLLPPTLPRNREY